MSSAKNAIKFSHEKDILLTRKKRDLNAKKRNYYEDPENKKQAAEERYHDKKESIGQYK